MSPPYVLCFHCIFITCEHKTMGIIQISCLHSNHLGPRYEGQLIFMAGPIPHPKRPPCTLSRRSSFFASDGQRPIVHSEWRRHHFNAICGGGVVYAVGPVRPSQSAPNSELPLARLVIHRQTSAHEQSRERMTVRLRSGILAYFCPRHH